MADVLKDNIEPRPEISVSGHAPSKHRGNGERSAEPEDFGLGNEPILALPNLDFEGPNKVKCWSDPHFLVNDESDLVIDKLAIPVEGGHGKVADGNGVSVDWGPKSSIELSSIIISILEKYRLASREQQPWLAREIYSSLIQEHIELGRTIPMVLPAFPFKSPNRTFKVLGHLPDKGEEVSMLHLDSMCAAIERVYPKGARIDIVSDGLMYNDLLGVSDKEVWMYGQALRKVAKEKGCSHINFIRLVHLLGESEIGEPLSEDEYLQRAPWFRTRLYQMNIPDGFDTAAHISNDPDTTLTYRGYIKFLERDIDANTVKDTSMSKKQIKKAREATAKSMIARGRAFAIAISNKFDKSIRLSIHPSTDATKISISLVPQKDGMVMTPWHSALVRSVDGTVRMDHAGNLPALTHDIILENGRPSYFREKSDLFNWTGSDVNFQYMYPSGILITPQNGCTSHSLEDIDRQKVLALAEKCSPIILRGFLPVTNKKSFAPADAGGGLQCICGYIGDKGYSDYLREQASISKERRLPHIPQDCEHCSSMVYQRPNNWTEVKKPVESSTSESESRFPSQQSECVNQQNIKGYQIEMKPAKMRFSRLKALVKKWFSICGTS